MYKQIQERFTGKLHFGLIRMPNQTKGPLIEKTNLDQFEHRKEQRPD